MNEFIDFIAEEPIRIFVGFALAVGLFGGIGYFIGDARGRGPLGFLLGLLFGPIGWVIVLLLSPEDGASAAAGSPRLCPECCGKVPSAARKCMHCGSVLEA